MASKVSAIINLWKDFDLSGFQKLLDTEAANIATRQDESDAARKKLVELSKEFKKSTPDDVRRVVSPLLKSFQGEIDNLSKRSKEAETAFLQAYQKLTDISDPLPVLEYCHSIQQKVCRLQDLEIENKQLRETLEEYNEEFKEVRNQDVTIKHLKEKIKQFEEKQDEEIQTRMKELDRALTREYEEKERTLQDAQTLMTKKLVEAESRALSLQRILDETQTELLDLKNREEEKTYARSDEFELLMNDLDQANQRAALAEQAVEELRQQLTEKGGPGRDGAPGTGGSLQGTEGGPSSAAEMDRTLDLLNRNSLQLELAAKEKEISALVEDVQRLQSSLKQLRDTSGNQIARLEEQLTHKCQVIERLEQRLQSQADYEDVKRELLILKSIEFGSSKSEGNTGTSGEAKPLEMLLLEKTKSLQTENTALKVANSDTQGRYERLLEDHAKSVDTMATQKALITKLEKDLSNVHSISSLCRGEGEGQPSSTELVAEAVRGSVSEYVPSPSPASVALDFTSAAESLLPIISAQRERFRERNLELESQNMILQKQIGLQQSEMDSLRADNVKLYEKIRFLQSYPQQAVALPKGPESRYSAQYEERLDPFVSFSRQERKRKYLSLSPHEKITLSLGRFIFGSKVGRTMAFLYTLFLHLLVFLVLYKMAYTESCKRDIASDCAQRFADHMMRVHKGQYEEE